jgi:myo-inositol-1(or 4)-monophosphatase
MIDWLNLFQEASEKVCRKVKPILGSEKAKKVMGMGAGGDLTKYIDLLAEKIVIETLEAKDASCTLISEECGLRKIGKSSGDYVILDSIDGTTNATHSIPFVSTSIAHATNGFLNSVDVALVKDLYRNTIFTAIRGKGANGGGKPLKSSTIGTLGKAIIAVDLSFQDNLPTLLSQLLPILCKTLKIRTLGSTALEVCYVASGALDAFIDLRGMTRATDLAAAYLILKESGGISTKPSGEDLNMLLKADARTAFFSAANKVLSGEILQNLKTNKL